MRLKGLLILVLLVLLAACGPSDSAIQTAIAETKAIEPTSIPTLEPSDTPFPTSTPYPTYTQFPTQTQLPTLTACPTFTPQATFTPQPTYTPLPIPTSITPTPTPSPLPTSKTYTAPPPSPSAALLESMLGLRRNIELLANDNPGNFIICSRDRPPSVPDNYEEIVGYPAYDLIASSAVVQDAYNRYSQAIDIIRITNKDLYQFCVNWLIGANTSDTIPFHIWGLARQGVNDALDVLLPGIAELENMP